MKIGQLIDGSVNRSCTARVAWSLDLHKANIDKRVELQIVKQAIRSLWALEYEIEDIQTEFAKGIGSIDIAHLTDDFVEDVMLQSKPLQGILMAIRLRQKVNIDSAILFGRKSKIMDEFICKFDMNSDV